MRLNHCSPHRSHSYPPQQTRPALPPEIPTTRHSHARSTGNLAPFNHIQHHYSHHHLHECYREALFPRIPTPTAPPNLQLLTETWDVHSPRLRLSRSSSTTTTSVDPHQEAVPSPPLSPTSPTSTSSCFEEDQQPLDAARASSPPSPVFFAAAATATAGTEPPGTPALPPQTNRSVPLRSTPASSPHPLTSALTTLAVRAQTLRLALDALQTTELDLGAVDVQLELAAPLALPAASPTAASTTSPSTTSSGGDGGGAAATPDEKQESAPHGGDVLVGRDRTEWPVRSDSMFWELDVGLKPGPLRVVKKNRSGNRDGDSEDDEDDGDGDQYGHGREDLRRNGRRERRRNGRSRKQKESATRNQIEEFDVVEASASASASAALEATTCSSPIKMRLSDGPGRDVLVLDDRATQTQTPTLTRLGRTISFRGGWVVGKLRGVGRGRRRRRRRRRETGLEVDLEMGRVGDDDWV
ncbi:MAG: hypothetical protein M1837_001503 [Sclerophora amabilis]|nr:MAG: hypothetical protein M1837_001503 [Sclerophora amabilis]